MPYFQWVPYVIPLIFSMLITGGLALYAWKQRDLILSANGFFYLMVAITIWIGGEILIVCSVSLSAKLFWTKFQYLGIVSTPVLLLIFVLQYSGRETWLKGRNLAALFFIPLVALLLVWTVEFHPFFYLDYGLNTSGPYIMFERTPGVGYWVNVIYSNCIILACLILLFIMLVRSPRLFSGQILIILMGTIAPWVGNSLYQLGLNLYWGLDLTPIFFSITGLLIGWALFRFQFLQLAPIARNIVVENMSDGMLLLDSTGRVIDLNPVMETFIGMPAVDTLGKPVEIVFSRWEKLVTQLKEKKEIQTVFSTKNDGGNRDYEMHVSTFSSPQGRLVGRLLIMRDITKWRHSAAELEQYAIVNAELLAEEHRQRLIAESLRQTMLSLSSSLDLESILGEILSQLRKVLPYHSAALYLLNGEDLELVRYIGPETDTNPAYIAPRKRDQITKIFRLRKTEIFIGAQISKLDDGEDNSDPTFSSLASPLVVGQEALGVLNIDRYEHHPFNEEDAEILQAFVTQAAIAIKNAELHQQAKTAAVIQERNRLAQDLHDAVNQTLFTASIMAEALPQVWEKDPAQGRQGVLEIRQLTRGALAEMRTLLMELRPQAITEKPVGDLLNQLVRAVSGRTRIPIDMTIQNDAILPSDVQIAVYRIAQESFNNIAKHSEASSVAVYLDADPEHILLIIEDDGLGFEIDEILVGHFGLEIMRERAQSIQADLLIISQPHAGTRIELSWVCKVEEI